MGGLPRRATIVTKLKEKQPELIAVEFGDFIEGHGKLDRLRAETYLKSLAYMNYDAITLEPSSFEGGVDLLREIVRNSSVPFVTLNAVDARSGDLLAAPFVIKHVGGLKVAIAGLTDPERVEKSDGPGHSMSGMRSSASGGFSEKDIPREIKINEPVASLEEWMPRIAEKSDIIILLSTLTGGKNGEIAGRFPAVNVIIINDKEARSAGSGSALIIKNIGVQGKELGELSLSIDDEGGIAGSRTTWFRLSKSYAEDRKALQILEDFYQRVAEDEELWNNIEPVHASYTLESDSENTYIGAAQCASCHEDIVRDWRASRHAKAFNTLAVKNRHFYPDCIVCHTTGAGLPSGYKIGQKAGHLEGVQCEVCHGPGSRHIATDGAFQLRVEIPRVFCAACHTDEVSPEFEEHFQSLWEKVNHSRIKEDAGVEGKPTEGTRAVDARQTADTVPD